MRILSLVLVHKCGVRAARADDQAVVVLRTLLCLFKLAGVRRLALLVRSYSPRQPFAHFLQRSSVLLRLGSDFHRLGVRLGVERRRRLARGAQRDALAQRVSEARLRLGGAELSALQRCAQLRLSVAAVVASTLCSARGDSLRGNAEAAGPRTYAVTASFEELSDARSITRSAAAEECAEV